MIMSNIKMLLQYDGTRYQGFKRRGSGKTISSKIEETLLRITEEELAVSGAVKTDPGVHASAQTISFLTGTALPAQELKTALNRSLPMDIAVVSAVKMPERFHASLNLKSCTYTYQIDLGRFADLFIRRYALHLPSPLDTGAMEEAGRLFCGSHDFTAFSAGRIRKSPVRSITELSLTCDDSGTQLLLSISADGFLRMMPQMMIGTLLDIGMGKRLPEEIPDIFSGLLPSSPPCSPVGLCLTETNYL